jgi:ArsR family transcriptional regulator
MWLKMHILRASRKGMSILTAKTDNETLAIKTSILKGIAHPVRVSIVEMLEGGELCACEIAENFTINRTTVSKHLGLMTKLDILEARKEGQNVYYRLKMRCLLTVIKCIEGVIDTGVCDC